jgi:transglutaminase-like putative cysteine protease
MVTAEPDLSLYLASDVLIQADHPKIVSTAAQITEGATDERDRARRIFYWVRDGIAYCIEGDRPALEVLEEGRGVCVTKGVLHVALLRAAGVPARLGHADYRSDVLRAIFPDSYMDRQPEVYPLHTFAEVYLDGEWITCDATIDREFGHDFGFPVMEFDGVHATDTMVGESNTVRRYFSRSGSELMSHYTTSLEDIKTSHDELRRQFQLLDVYVELRRMHKRMDVLERAIVNRL